MRDALSGSLSGLPTLSPLADCWNQIGTTGDRSCPELETHIHCRNCPVFASAARTFFDRSAPPGYLAEWTRWLAGTSEATGSQDDNRGLVSVLIFRLGQEWLAFPTPTVSEVTVPRPVHRIPHRSNQILVGLVNLRGQLQLCVSLHGLLGVQESTGIAGANPKGSGPDSSPHGRLVVLRDRERSETWVFICEEVLGVHRLARSHMHSVSSSLANPEVSFSQAILSWEERSVSLLDEQRVFAALRSIGP